MSTGGIINFRKKGNVIAISGVADAPVRQLVPFWIETSRYALPLAAVERAVRVVELTPLPKAPDIVLGIVNFEGRVVPVINVRKRFRHPDREVQLSDQLIVARTAQRPVALLVDRAESLIERAEREIIQAATVLPGLEYVCGIAKLGDGLILIHDLDSFLSLDEERELGEALAPTGT